jgi:hypothetical protein
MSGTQARVTIGVPTYNRATLLRETMESVLAQTYPHFRLLVSDNASDDDTRDVVASFGDPRIDYAPLDRNIGLLPNFNRVIELADTEFLVLLPSDDLLYPDYLRRVVEVLDHYPAVGAVHTAYDAIAADSSVVWPAENVLGTAEPLTIESPNEFLHRALSSEPIVCFSTAIFRTRAVRDAGGFHEGEEPFPDLPMGLRIALRWSWAFLSQTLAGFRVHSGSDTAQLGSFTGTGYSVPLHRILRDRRRDFLAGAAQELSPDAIAAYEDLVERTFRADEVRALARDAGQSLPWSVAAGRLVRLAREEPRVLGQPRLWRLVAAQLGGRQVRRAVSRGLTRTRPSRADERPRKNAE